MAFEGIASLFIIFVVVVHTHNNTFSRLLLLLFIFLSDAPDIKHIHNQRFKINMKRCLSFCITYFVYSNGHFRHFGQPY